MCIIDDRLESSLKFRGKGRRSSVGEGTGRNIDDTKSDFVRPPAATMSGVDH
jgi:hypothetical protein